jgi:hypothetical protein
MLGLLTMLGCTPTAPAPVVVNCTPPIEGETYWCFSYGPYPGAELACTSASDCPAAISPCSQATCIDGSCGQTHAAPNSALCGDPNLRCSILGACCGWYEVES